MVTAKTFRRSGEGAVSGTASIFDSILRYQLPGLEHTSNSVTVPFLWIAIFFYVYLETKGKGLKVYDM